MTESQCNPNPAAELYRDLGAGTSGRAATPVQVEGEASRRPRTLRYSGLRLSVNVIFAAALSALSRPFNTHASAATTPPLNPYPKAKSTSQLQALQDAKMRWVHPDERALSCPESAEVVGTVEGLARYLTQPFERAADKHRAIFRWVADRIAYDAQGFRTGSYGDCSPEGVLASRLGVCSGYAGLYKALADVVGLECIQCRGYSKGYGYKSGKKLRICHEWNCVKIDEQWHPLDACWAAGVVDHTYAFRKVFNQGWWLVPPEHFVYSHYPEDPQWTCLDAPPSLKQFGHSLLLRPAFFEHGIELASHTEALIQCRGKKPVRIKLQASGPSRYLMATLEGDSDAVEVKYDAERRRFTLVVCVPQHEGCYKLDIYVSPQQCRKYTHLVAYTIERQ